MTTQNCAVTMVQVRTLRICILLAAAASLLAAQFIEKPYLQLGNSPGNLALLWHTDNQDAAWRVEVRNSDESEWRAMDAPQVSVVEAGGIPPHRVYRAALKGLVAGGDFRYRVTKAGTPVFESSGRAMKAAGQPQHFIVTGDIAQGSMPQKEVAYQMALSKPDFVFVAGDIVYSRGRISEYRTNFFPVYNAETADPQTGAPLLRSVPFIAAVGNHDTAVKDFEKYPDLFAYFLYWDQPMNGPLSQAGAKNTPVLQGNTAAQPAFLAAAGDRYPRMANFSFDAGNAHWTVLDSNIYVDWSSAELRAWIKSDIEAAKSATWRFVAFHHPGYNSAVSHFADQWMRALSPLFEDLKVDVVFSGHVHNYQRTYPLRVSEKGEIAVDGAFADGQNAKPKGIVYLVTGAGGAGLYKGEQNGTLQPFTNKFSSDVHSFTVVDIDGKKMKIRQVSETGAELDAFQIQK